MICWIVFPDTESIAESYGLPEFASLFQSEVLTILKACWWPENDCHYKRNIVISSNSQVAFKAGAVQERSELSGPHTLSHPDLGSGS